MDDPALKKISRERGISIEGARRSETAIVGEVKGSVAEDFQRELLTVLWLNPNVLRAYLAIISIGGQHPEVALCLRFRDDVVDERAFGVAAELFRAQFSRTQSMAMLPLDQLMEDRMQRVKPFLARE